ncbi:MAG: arylesterase [Pseudomonadota bacterium]
MRITVLLVWLIGCIMGPALANANGSGTLLVVGDSLSAAYNLEIGEGWVNLLGDRLAENGYDFTVVNASISGDTTSGGRARLPAALARHKPTVVVLELGGNDGLRGIPIKTMRANLTAMIEASREAGAAVVLLGIRIPENYGRRYADEFFATYGELARDFSLAHVEFFMDGVALDDSLMQSDGIHPNVDAQPILLENAWPAIKSVLSETTAAVAAK